MAGSGGGMMRRGRAVQAWLGVVGFGAAGSGTAGAARHDGAGPASAGKGEAGKRRGLVWRGATRHGKAGKTMNNDKCNDCSSAPGPGSVVRLVGRDGSGNVIELCSRCWIRRNNDTKVPVGLQLKAKGKKKR